MKEELNPLYKSTEKLRLNSLAWTSSKRDFRYTENTVVEKGFIS